MGGEGVYVAAEVEFVADDLGPLFLGFVECGDEGVDVYRGASGDYDFFWLSSY